MRGACAAKVEAGCYALHIAQGLGKEGVSKSPLPPKNLWENETSAKKYELKGVLAVPIADAPAMDDWCSCHMATIARHSMSK